MDCITTIEGVRINDICGVVYKQKDGQIRITGKELSSSTQIYFTPNNHKTLSKSVCYEEHKDGMVAVALTIAPTTANFFVAGVESSELVHLEVPKGKEYVKQKNMLYTFIVDRSPSM